MQQYSFAISSIHQFTSRKHDLYHQWEKMCNHEEVSTIRQEINSSWKRCLSKRVDPLRQQAPVVFTEATLKQKKEEKLELLRLVEPYMDQLYEQLAAEDILVMLSDSNGVILEGKATARGWSMVEKLHFYPGADWSESGAGTNAVGTAVAERKPVQVFGAEHFCQGWHTWVCSAAPIFDPVTDELLGVLDISGTMDRVQAHSLPAVVHQVDRIRQDLSSAFMTRDVPTWRAISDALDQPLAIFDTKLRVVRLNERARTVLGLRAGCTIQDLFTEDNASSLDSLHWNTPIPVTFRSLKPGTWVATLYPYHVANRLLGGLIVFYPIKVSNNSTRSPSASFHISTIITQNNEMIRLIEKAGKAARSDMNVLLVGETGVGKEIFARSIHESGPRGREPFVPVNCGAIPRDLLASELFGYEPGAFTGATAKGRPGKFVAADGGTIFLDEIGELPLEAQVYLLRVLEERAVVPVGGTEPRPIDVRIIAATNRDLEEEIQRGRFRADLYYRLNVLRFRIPPLRERKEDIPLLVRHFLLKCDDTGIPWVVEDAAMDCLMRHSWPGNVRQLKNVVAQAVFNAEDHRIRLEDLPPELVHSADGTTTGLTKDNNESAPVSRFNYRKVVNREVLEHALKMTDGNVSRAARLLGVSRMTVYRKAKQYNLST
ncbi:sigma-54-dependent Fis family transcriptional regulator [Kyrpidia tusciae]|uniref:GAF modulated sigma54 specific transcriptional regulator, Fis family n=1 Tax=Kyrpidia tusciae (strain DSM 2912 / NBRC 15312 / T2) TaxID=562970 RepID=D5WX04_KYRT2|nr:sigma-54-dependent Fis family transcriptional regulator [Kyrpidia tusciae]ADG05855.1 GAF modulated sigma54 specific transcriptional regulator, Fis family [Kyrpidia tusciae DSM 2912]